jgi:hypothetical protein
MLPEDRRSFHAHAIFHDDACNECWRDNTHQRSNPGINKAV